MSCRTFVRVSSTALLLLCGCAHIEDPGGPSPDTTAKLRVEYVNATIDLKKDLAEATDVFEGTVDRVSVEPFWFTNDDTVAKGRRIAWVGVTKTYAGEIEQGTEVAVWYGTELQPGAKLSEPANITIEPKAGERILVMATLASIGNEAKELGYTLYLPLEGDGVGRITDNPVSSSRGDSFTLEEVERLTK